METIAQNNLHGIMGDLGIETPPEKKTRIRQNNPNKSKRRRKGKFMPKETNALSQWMMPKAYQKQKQNGSASSNKQNTEGSMYKNCGRSLSPISICSSPDHDSEEDRMLDITNSHVDDVIDLEDDDTDQSCQDIIYCEGEKTTLTNGSQTAIPSNDSTSINNKVSTKAPETIEMPSAHEHESLPPILQKWLANEDAASDRLLKNLIPVEQSNLRWSFDSYTFTTKREIPTKSFGPTFKVIKRGPCRTRPIDMFNYLYDKCYFELLAENVNVTASRTDPECRITKEDIIVFVAILILQGLDHYSGGGNNNGWTKAMTPERFGLINRSLQTYVSDNTAAPAEDKPRKMTPLLSYLKVKYSTLYYPGRDIILDESLLKPQSRCFKQRVSAKAIDGVHAYAITDARNGFICDYVVHTVNASENLHRNPLDTAIAKIMTDLIPYYLNRGHTLILDEYFNSPLLARYLKINRTDCFGPLRANRAPAFFAGSHEMLQVGELLESACDNVHVMMWGGQSTVLSTLSTFIGETGSEDKSDRSPRAIVDDYKRAISVVEERNSTLKDFSVEIESESPSMRLFRRLLNVSLYNAFVLYKEVEPNATHGGFRRAIVDAMLEKCGQTSRQKDSLRSKDPAPPRSVGTQTPSPGLEDRTVNVKMHLKGHLEKLRPILEGNHFVGVDHSSVRRCVWCIVKSSKYICKQCDVTLCIVQCFEDYHTVTDQRRKGVPL